MNRMLSETFKHLTTPCALHLKSMGYLKELIALEARFHRCTNAWQPHLENTKSVITDAIEVTRKHNKVVILGAGILSDIPIKALSADFEAVVLVDVCFLNQTRRSLKAFSNVELKISDITGVTASLYAGEFPVPMTPSKLSFVDADLVISANILSQLPLIPTAHLRKTKPQLDEEEVKRFGHDIVKNHLGLLDTCPGTVCLISEVERQFCDDDRILETENPLWGCALEHDGQEWLWDLAPLGEASPDYAIRNRVIGSFWQSK